MNQPKDSPRRSLLSERPAFFWFALVLGVAFFGLYTNAAWIVYAYGNQVKFFGWDFAPSGKGWVVTHVTADGPAAGKLQRRDRIVAFNGDRTVVRLGPEWHTYMLSPDSFYTVRVARGSIENTYSLHLPPLRLSGNRLWAALYLVVSLAFYVLALLMGLLKPGDRVTQIGFLACLAVSLRIASLALPRGAMWGHGAASTFYTVLWLQDPWHLILGYHFFQRFVGNILKERLWSILKVVLYGAGGVICIVLAVPALLAMRGLGDLASFAGQHGSFLELLRVVRRLRFPYYDAFALLAMCAVIARAHRLVKEADQRRRVRWVLFGSLTGIAPDFAYIIWRVLNTLGVIRSSAEFVETFRLIINLWLLVIPFSLGYAVLKHRALGIGVVVRQGVKYLLARNVLQFILLLPVLGLVLPIFSDPNRTVAQLFLQDSLYLNLFLLLSLGLSLRHRRQLRTWIDRRFFREAYNEERILLDVIERIKELDDISEIARLVSTQVDAALHPRRLSVFYREKEKSDMVLGYSSSGTSENQRIPENAWIMRIMRASPLPRDFPMAPQDGLPAAEAGWLERLEANLIVPISATPQRLAGLLVLGEKKSDEPYTPADRKLLQAIAGQMGIVHERFWLQEQVDEDHRMRREVLAHLPGREINLLKECPLCGTCFDSTVQECPADQSELTISLPVERTIDSKYRLERRIGKGGMGAVFEGMDLRLNRKVAVKVMMGNLFGNRAALRRFEREAQAAAKLTHPNIVLIHDFGRIGGDGAFLVMEHLSGTTWRGELNRRGVLAPTAVAAWVDQLLHGLRAAHEAGVVHRDLKPENVMVTRGVNDQDLIKILDFGLAKMRLSDSPDTQSVTMPGTMLGTLGYMSPEQLTGEMSDERGDIFSVGVMIIEAITGRRPFEGRNFTELLGAILHEQFRLPGDAEETGQLNGVLRKCLAKNAADRFPSVVALHSELVNALRACRPLAAKESPNDNIETRSMDA
jgi:GAF domain-containing protein